MEGRSPGRGGQKGVSGGPKGHHKWPSLAYRGDHVMMRQRLG